MGSHMEQSWGTAQLSAGQIFIWHCGFQLPGTQTLFPQSHTPSPSCPELVPPLSKVSVPVKHMTKGAAWARRGCCKLLADTQNIQVFGFNFLFKFLKRGLFPELFHTPQKHCKGLLVTQAPLSVFLKLLLKFHLNSGSDEVLKTDVTSLPT